jgi:O-antigen/teichoic acid export membrane protein
MVAVAASAAANAILVRAAGFGELAVFSAVNTMRSMVLFLPALIARVTAPRLNHMRAAGDHTGYRRTFRIAVIGNASIAFALALALTAAGPRILRLFGKDFAVSMPLVVLLLGSVVLEVIANNLFQALFTAGRLWRNLLIVCVWTAILILGVVLLAPRYGATGLALSYLAAWSASAFLYGRQA